MYRITAVLAFALGRNDNRGVNADGQYDQTRDWFYQNVWLKDALVAKGYDVNYV